MGKQEIRIDISGDTTSNNSELTLYKNVNTSKTSIENELIYSKKITDIPSRYKTEKTNIKHDIVCYNIETPNDKHDQNTDDAINKRKTTRKPKKVSKRVKQSENKNSNSLSDPHDHYFLTDYPDEIHKKSIHTVESNISKEPIKWKTSRTRLLHSMLRPDTSKTSNIVLPDINYTLSTEKLQKPKYPKNVPPPVFKHVGSYKGKIPVMTSKERLRQRTKLRKEQQQLEKLKKTESKELQQLKFLKKKENTQYDILFGKHNPEEIIEEHDDDESLESQHKKQTVTKNLLKRFRKRPKSESEIEITMIESPRPITKSSSVNLFMIDDDDEDSEIKDLKEESEDEPEEESEESEEELDQEAKQDLEQARKQEPAQEVEELLRQETQQELEQQPEQEPEQPEELEKEAEHEPEVEPGEVELEEEEEEEEEDEEELEGNEYDEELLIEDYFEEEPNKENLVEIIPKKESSVASTAVEAIEIPIEIIHKEREHTNKPKRKVKKSPCVDECTEQCGYIPPYDDTKAGIKSRVKKRLVIFKECDSQLCTYDEGKECNKLMINIGTSGREESKSVEIVHSNRKAFFTESRSSRRCSNDYNLTEIKTVTAGNPRNGSFQPNCRNSIGNRSETVEKELQTTSTNSYRNDLKINQRNRVTRNIKKSTYDSKEVLYEKELQSYDYVSDSVSQNHQNLKATDHNLLLDLNFQNKVTQTYHSRKKEKNIQTTDYFPSNKIEKNKTSTNYNSYSKNAFQLSTGKNFKVIRKTPLGRPKLSIINHPTRCQSQMPKPTIDIIYKNSKYLYPKYVKSIIPHENSHKISVNNRKNSYDNNNYQYDLPINNKNYKVFTYFVNVQQEPNDNLQHSRNLKTIDRDLIIKFV